MRVWSWRQTIQQSRLGSTTKLVLLNLSIYMNDLGEGCFPSVRRQAADTGLSERAVYAALALAEKAGFLRRSKLRRNGVEQNEYAASYPEDEPPACGAGVQGVQPPPASGAGTPLHMVQPNSPGELSSEHSSPPLPPAPVRMPFRDLPDAWAEWANRERGWDDAIIRDVWAAFRDYWTTGKGRNTKREDWEPTWRNWCRKENIRPGAAPSASRPSHADRVRQEHEANMAQVRKELFGDER